MRTITFLFLSCFSFVFAFAQSNGNLSKMRYTVSQELQSLKEDKEMNVRISQYNFRKTDKNHRIVEFTLLDAIKIENYLMKQKGVLTCETHALDKTAKITTQPEFDHKSLIPELEKMGYIITGLRSSLDRVTFTAKGSCNDKASNAVANNQTEPGCQDCGKQQVKQDIMDKFKDADYGGSTLINFDLGKPAAPINTSVATDNEK